MVLVFFRCLYVFVMQGHTVVSRNLCLGEYVLLAHLGKMGAGHFAVSCLKSSAYSWCQSKAAIPGSGDLFIGFLHLHMSIFNKFIPSLMQLFTYEPRHNKTNTVTVRPAKTQISLGIRPLILLVLSCRGSYFTLASKVSSISNVEQSYQQLNNCYVTQWCPLSDSISRRM